MNDRADIPVLVLAAGGSGRFGSDKNLALVGRRPLLERTLTEVLRHVRPDQVRLVIGPGHEGREAIAVRAGVRVVVAHDAAVGVRSSIAAAFAAVPAGCSGAVVLLGDDPLAARELGAVLDAAVREPARVVAVRRDPPVPHPVHVPRTAWDDELDGAPDRGLRALVRGSDTRWIDPTTQHPVDVDEPADLDVLTPLLLAPSELRTERLVLRRWRDEDRDAFAAMNADPRVVEHLPAPLTRVQSDAMLDRIEDGFETHGFGLWALEDAATGALLGYTGLSVPRFDAAFTPCVEVGWRLAPAAWGHGYATEAARASIVDGFTRAGLHEIVSFTVPANVRSIAVMERLGMTHDAADDFDHPLLADHSPLRRHVLYRTGRG